ncbi:MAG: N-acetylmuramoyl-L-alanine amidase [Bacillota bacterium]|nr:N-acetylmuramoyl-L-alanine amidase [Bacillota bacterium]
MHHFKHISIFFLFIFLAACLIGQGAFPQTASAQTAVINTEVVNIRSGPGTNYQVSGNLLKDAEVDILEKQGEWSQVRFGSVSGWVHNDLLKFNQPDIYLQVINGPINVRTGPGTSYSKAGMIDNQAIYPVVGQENDWYQIQLSDGKMAYVANWLVSEVQNPATAPSEPVKPPQDAVQPATPPVDPLAAPTVILNGTKLIFDVPPMIESGRTMVPLRAIFEAMGATVNWNNDTRTVTSQRSGIEIVLPLGSLSPTINGTTYQLDVPAKIVNDRTLAPLRFVGEAFGGEVGWDGATRTVTIVMEDEIASPPDTTTGEVVITVKGDEVNLRSGPSTGYDKVDSALGGEDLAVLAQQNGWYQVSRGGRTAWVAGWLVEARTLRDGNIDSSTDNASDNENDQQEKPQDGHGYTEEDGISIEDDDLNRRGDENAPVDDGFLTIATRLTPDGYRLVMKTAEPVEPEVIESKEGKKVLYTFKDVAVKTARDEAYFFIGSGKNARIPIVAQTVGDTTWVTVEIPRAYHYTTTVEEDGCKQVFTIPSQLLEVQNILLNNGNQIVVLRATSGMEYQEAFRNGTLTLTLPETSIGFVRDSYAFSGVVSGMTVEENNDGNGVQIQVFTGGDLDNYQVSRSLSGDMISIILGNKNQITTPEDPENPVTIVIDPGHGGKDSGAISKARDLYEKNVVLPISLQVRDLLKKEGYKVIMTRDDDTYVGLNERAEIANKAKADLFVSIHADSVESTVPNGTGTFYYAPSDNPALSKQQYQRSLLADLLQKAMLEKCGRADRGIRQGNFCVLRETNMSSALVETAFISNPVEAKLLGKTTFRTQAAEAIAEAIQKYVKLML